MTNRTPLHLAALGDWLRLGVVQARVADAFYGSNGFYWLTLRFSNGEPDYTQTADFLAGLGWRVDR